MEIKSGYRNSEIGILPNEWVVDTLESTTPNNQKNSIVDGPFGSNLKTIHYKKSGIPIVTSGFVTEGKFQADNYIYVDQEKFNQEKRSAVFPGDIVMAKIGARCGSSAILPLDHEVGILSGNALKITVDEKRHSPYFIWALLWNLYASGRIDTLITVGAQPAISMPNLKKLNIPQPPLPEQQAIAKVLSDMDVLIQAQEALIEKKRLIKQGVMQALLTGKRRLPGFSGKWTEATLGELGEISSAGVDKKIIPSETAVRLLNYLDVYSKDFIKSEDLTQSVTSPIQKAQKCSIKKGDVFFTPSSEIPTDIANSAVSLEDIEDGVYSYHIVRFRLFEPENWDLLFRLYIFKTKYYFDQAEKVCAGSGQRYVINLGGFQSLRIKYPKDIKEQQAISEIIYDLDTEIELLQKRLEKYKFIKQGMMQELLTGRTRLV